MKTKVLVMTRTVDFVFNYLRYDWPLEEQVACCEKYLADTMPNIEAVVLSDMVLSLKMLVAGHKPGTILIPARLIFGSDIKAADHSVKLLIQSGFNVVEVIPNAKLSSIPEDLSRLVIEGDTKITSYCKLCPSTPPHNPLNIISDRMNQYVVDKTILTDFHLVPAYLNYSPNLKSHIEALFSLKGIFQPPIKHTLDDSSASDSTSDDGPDE